MAALLRGAGADADGFAARQLTVDHVRSADLVLGMTREHRAVTVGAWPASVRHSFTFLELSRLLGEVDLAQLPVGNAATRLAAAIPLAAVMRHRRAQSPELDDILDPYRGSEADCAVAFSAITQAAAVFASRI
jgi:protein-tyrosine phosphatase